MVQCHEIENKLLSGTADAFIYLAGRYVLGLRSDPGFGAVLGTSDSQDLLHESRANPPPLVRGRDTELVDPELWRFVGVHVDDARHHSDHGVAVESHYHMVARVGQEFPGPSRIDRTVENAIGNAMEGVFVA